MSEPITKAEVNAAFNLVERCQKTLQQINGAGKKACIDLFEKFGVDCIKLHESLCFEGFGEEIPDVTHVKYNPESKEIQFWIITEDENERNYDSIYDLMDVYPILVRSINKYIDAGVPTTLWSEGLQADFSPVSFDIKGVDTVCNFEGLALTLQNTIEKVSCDDITNCVMGYYNIESILIPSKFLPKLDENDSVWANRDIYVKRIDKEVSRGGVTYIEKDPCCSIDGNDYQIRCPYKGQDIVRAIFDAIEEYQAKGVPAADWGGGNDYVRVLENYDGGYHADFIIREAQGSFYNQKCTSNSTLEVSKDGNQATIELCLFNYIFFDNRNGWNETCSLNLSDMTEDYAVTFHFKYKIVVSGAIAIGKLMRHYNVSLSDSATMLNELRQCMAKEAKGKKFKTVDDFCPLFDQLGIWYDYNSAYNED